MHGIDVGLALNALSGVLMAALGLFVATAGSRGRVNTAFALFAVSFGAIWVIDNLLLEGGHASLAAQLAMGLCSMLAAVGLVLVARFYPRPVTEADRPHVVAAALAGLFVVAAFAWLLYPHSSGYATGRVARGLGLLVLHAAAWAVLLFFALGYRPAPDGDAKQAAAARLMSGALVLYPAYFVARLSSNVAITAGPTQDGPLMELGALLLILLLTVGLATLWLRNAARARPASGERAVAWLVLVAALAGLPSFGLAGENPGFGIVRTAGVVILAYAILRHQLLGIDMTVRWTLSRSTVAALFVTVFFTASEGAQIVLGGEEPLVGLVAAGLLVFALSPLQRAADRLAAKAVPPVAHEPHGSQVGKEEAYRAALKLALRGRLTQDEELDLARLSDELGLTNRRAREIWAEVERQSGHVADAS